MNENTIIYATFLIFVGAAVLSTVALYTRQSLLVAYMLLGVLLGPWGLKLMSDVNVVRNSGDIGIVFLLFLLGLNLHPQDLISMFKKTFWVTLFSTIIFMAIGFVVCYFSGFTIAESLVVGAAVTFSSTIIGLKLLPTEALHHQHIGELLISILLLQDLLAIVILVIINVCGIHHFTIWHFLKLIVSLPLLIFVAFVFVRYVLIYLFRRFDKMHEYMFLLAIAWCLTMVEFANSIGLSFEIGAFIAGVSLASNPISLYISESLKPIRDFFLVLFFFSIGASFNLQYFHVVMLPSIMLAALLIIIKPLIFRLLLKMAGETKKTSWEVGIRLGQTSCFSILVVYLAAKNGLIDNTASYLVQATTMLTFFVSSYLVVWLYPTPLAVSDRLRKD